MKNRLTFFLCIISFTLFAQQQNNQGFKWIQHHGDDIPFNAEQVKSIQTDRWGNVYVAGNVNDLFVRDSNDNIIRSVQFPSTDSLYNNGGVDVWLAKYSPSGQLLWHRYAGTGSDDIYYDMVADQNGNCYVAGMLVSSQSIRPTKSFGGLAIPSDSLGSFIAKVDSGGNLLWHKHFGSDTINPSTYLPYRAFSLKLTLRQNAILCFFEGGGQTVFGYQKLFNIDSLDLSVHEARFDLNGNYLGVKSFPFPRFDRIPQIRNIQASANGRVISGNINRDTVLVGTDTLLLGSNSDNAFAFGFDTALNHVWTFKANNQLDQFLDSKISGDTLVVSGHFDLFNNPTAHFDTIQYSGNPNVAKGGAIFLFNVLNGDLMGFTPAQQIGRLAIINTGAAGVSSKYIGTGGSFTHQLTYSGTNNYIEAVSRSVNTNQDAYFAVFDHNGNFVAEDVIYSSATSNGDDRISAVHFDDSTVYIGGLIGDTVIVPGVDTFVTRGRNDAFVAAYRLNFVTSLKENKREFIKAENGILAYPNPTSGSVNLMGKAIHQEGLLYNLKGQLVRSYALDVNAFQQEINLSGLPSGVYFLIINGANNRQQLKLVKTE